MWMQKYWKVGCQWHHHRMRVLRMSQMGHVSTLLWLAHPQEPSSPSPFGWGISQPPTIWPAEIGGPSPSAGDRSRGGSRAQSYPSPTSFLIGKYCFTPQKQGIPPRKYQKTWEFNLEKIPPNMWFNLEKTSTHRDWTPKNYDLLLIYVS